MKEKNKGRYSVPSNEDFEPGSNNEVLKNFLEITSKTEIESREAAELERAELELFDIYTINHQFSAQDICNIHELWLGDIYPCAGKYRNVNMSKGNFLFAAANCIPRLMHTLEKEYLAKYTPCHFSNDEELAYALGIVHVELIIIHPFREGNGRTARLLSDLMVLQANRPSFDFSFIDSAQNECDFNKYIQAIHEGVSQNYEPIKTVFLHLLANNKSGKRL